MTHMRKTKASLVMIAATAITVATLFLLPFTPREAVHTVIIGRGDLVKTTLLEGAISYEAQQPCIALSAGRVSRVNVRQGQRVQKGELLFSMDTAAEEEALSALALLKYEREQAAQSAEAVALIEAVSQSDWSLRQTEAELKARIAAGQIRANADGVVGGVYVEEGSYVSAMDVLGAVHAEQKCVVASMRATTAVNTMLGDVAAVRSAAEKELGLAVLSGAEQPTVDAATAGFVQQCVFTMEEPQTLAGVEVGERVTLELLREAAKDQPLAPLSAIGANDLLWVVIDGKAYPQKVEVGSRNGQYAVVDEALLGSQVILLPDSLSLYPGCPVKEAKRR